jgi:hypothetical protein
MEFMGKILRIPALPRKVEVDMGVGLILIWIILLFFPVMALYWRRWLVFSIYSLGCLTFLIANLRNLDGWNDLASFAMLLVIVVPLYVLASIVWLLPLLISRKKP